MLKYDQIGRWPRERAEIYGFQQRHLNDGLTFELR